MQLAGEAEPGRTEWRNLFDGPLAQAVEGRIGLGALLQADEGHGGGFRERFERDAQCLWSAVVPTAIGAAAAEEHALGRLHAVFDFVGAADAMAAQDKVAAQGHQSVRGGFYPGVGSGHPGPAERTAIGGHATGLDAGEQATPEGAFGASRLRKPTGGTVDGTIDGSRSKVERYKQRGGPGGFVDGGMGTDRAVGVLPRSENTERPPTALSVGLRIDQGESGPGCGFQPRRIAAVIAPTAIRILDGGEPGTTLVCVLHHPSYRRESYGALAVD